MLAIGYSANTSRSGIGTRHRIVVDRCIVVIENVERVIEDNPDRRSPRPTNGPWPRSPPPLIAISLVLLLVFVPVAFHPCISGQLFRQFAVAVSAVHGHLGAHALT